MSALIQALRAVWIGNLPWIIPLLVAALGLAGTWLGADLSGIKAAFINGQEDYWVILKSYPSILTTIILIVLHVAAGAQQHHDREKLKKTIRDQNHLIESLQREGATDRGSSRKRKKPSRIYAQA
ncbi:hypothetical protein [Neopusillimonas aromaticivorans]|uniref:hypothetical protein n=1 Tax=Neopusillimonas aromaticivorans TaxID=2979868 RepID=UPI002595C861|nr:hypothetical protein [Neopusillimonas aromaticivorans]WJJ93980.1 hypothetical protein N7E01_02020 [Neopusillimonas aromaticivorans]